MLELLVISGPSGVGKGTIINRLISNHPTLSLAVSATTRQPRTGEVDGTHYYFMNDDEFDHAIQNELFIEWAPVHQYRYGTLRREVLRIQNSGKLPLLEIDTDGAMQVKKNFPKATLLFIEPPSLQSLIDRLYQRGTETDDQISRRVQVAQIELSRKAYYNFVVVNDIVENAVTSVLEIIEQLQQSSSSHLTTGD